MENTNVAQAVTPSAKKNINWKALLFDNTSIVFTPFEDSKNIYIIAGIGMFWSFLLFLVWSSASVLLPTPMDVIQELINFLSDPEFYRDVLSSIFLTCEAMALSIVVSCLFVYLSTTKLFKPLAMFLVKLRFMSLAGFVFTFTLILHGGFKIKMLMLMFGIVPFFSLSLLSVMEKITDNEYNLWTTLGYSKWEQLWQIAIRGKADATIEAIRSNFAMGWMMITMVEMFSTSDGGVGVLLYKFNKSTQLNQVFAIQIVILTLGIIFDYALKQTRYAVFPHTKLAEKR